jgi:signal peptidase I
MSNISANHATDRPTASLSDAVPHARFDSAPPRASRAKSLRTLVEGLVFVLLAAALVRTWCIQAFTIVGRSMAPTLVASHVVVGCPRCAYEFTAGVEGGESNDRPARCPNCGDAMARIEASIATAGDTVLVDKSAYAWRSPRRWEVVAFRQPGDERALCTKRVVGLPGEEVSIIAGDVYVDGVLARNDLAEQRSLAITVHDDRFRPPSEKMSMCWRSEPDSRWTMTHDGFSFAADRASSTINFRHSSFPTDWLTYHQRRCDASGAVSESPIDDAYAYNQTQPIRELHVVRDLALSLHFTAQGTGVIYLGGSDGVRDFVCAMSTDGVARLFCDDQLVAEGQCDSPLHRGNQVEFSLVDAACRLAVEGREVLAYPFEPVPADGPTTTRPFALGCHGMNLQVRDLRIDRDVYYGPPASGRPIEPLRLGADEYFLLSDNAPLGIDSREPGFGPAVPYKSFVGKPFAASGVRRPWPERLPSIQVPALRQIRYIR